MTVEEKPEFVTNCETNWVRVKLLNHKDLYAGVFYMPHRNISDCKELEKSINLVTDNGTKDRDILLAGDFNCPGINWNNNTVSTDADDRPIQEAILDITSNAYLTQVHDQPTRLSNTIDLVLTSNPTLMKSTRSIPGISDHNIVVTDFDIKPCVKKEKPRKFYKYKQANWENVQKDIEKTSEEIKELYLSGENVQTLWNHFKNSLNTSIHENIPTGTTKTLSRLPWINRPILRVLRRKKRYFRKAKTTNDWNAYKKIQKHCKKIIRQAEWKHINDTIIKGMKENNTKPFWNFIKSKKKDNVGVSPLKAQGRLFSDSKTKAEILLRQFKSVFTQDNDTPLPDITQTSPIINDIEITHIGIAKLLRDLKPHKAPGPDAIPNLVLKTCAESISKSLCTIYQSSVDSGSLPDDWLTANISSAFKKGDRHLAENYRPISLTSVPCKILEHILCKHLMTHFDKHNLLTNLNHGFRSGYSCESQLLTTAQDLLNSFEDDKQVDIAILDFSKAFDTVPHRKLLHKLHHLGIQGPLHAWLKCFLSKRTMKVVLEGQHSETTTVDSGVPQGTVLGPLLFLCHINDLPKSVVSKVRLFADDCLLYREINNAKDHVALQNDLKALEIWADTWGMRFNASKCNILSIKPKTHYIYELNKTILKSVTSNPYLGILFTDNLKWGDHINNITKKANSTLGFLRRNLGRCPTVCKKNAYMSLVRSSLEYGSVVWDPYYQKDIDQLERVQRGAARFITGDYTSRTPGSVKKLLKKLDFQTLQERRKQLRLVYFYKIVEGLVPAIPCEKFLVREKTGRQIRSTQSKDFITQNPVENYVRNNNKSFKIKPCTVTEQYTNSFFIRTTIEWNHLSDQIVNAQSVPCFRAAIRKP